ncbi:hypothetical protein VTN00DRAFT_1015 [Thermoascus crustaceus]|uniref:uncharacterized protein n=1 Tax=Thermoascus crustaceus TaxID=5088 RepID=UPI003743BB61
MKKQCLLWSAICAAAAKKPTGVSRIEGFNLHARFSTDDATPHTAWQWMMAAQLYSVRSSLASVMVLPDLPKTQEQMRGSSHFRMVLYSVQQCSLEHLRLSRAIIIRDERGRNHGVRSLHQVRFEATTLEHAWMMGTAHLIIPPLPAHSVAWLRRRQMRSSPIYRLETDRDPPGSWVGEATPYKVTEKKTSAAVTPTAACPSSQPSSYPASRQHRRPGAPSDLIGHRAVPGPQKSQ